MLLKRISIIFLCGKRKSFYHSCTENDSNNMLVMEQIEEQALYSGLQSFICNA